MAMINSRTFSYLDAQSMNSDFTSKPIRLDYINGYSVIADINETSATLAGTIKLEVSNDYEEYTDDARTVKTAGTWAEIVGSAKTLTGGSLEHGWNYDGTFYRWVRVNWDRTSGEGNITAKACIKSVG